MEHECELSKSLSTESIAVSASTQTMVHKQSKMWQTACATNWMCTEMDKKNVVAVVYNQNGAFWWAAMGRLFKWKQYY